MKERIKMISIALFNYHRKDKMWVNIIRNLLCPLWFDFEKHSIDINGLSVGLLILLYSLIK
jgi:hypothetical protein